jgi:hypothetical protein
VWDVPKSTLIEAGRGLEKDMPATVVTWVQRRLWRELPFRAGPCA